MKSKPKLCPKVYWKDEQKLSEGISNKSTLWERLIYLKKKTDSQKILVRIQIRDW